MSGGMPQFLLLLCTNDIMAGMMCSMHSDSGCSRLTMVSLGHLM